MKNVWEFLHAWKRVMREEAEIMAGKILAGTDNYTTYREWMATRKGLLRAIELADDQLHQDDDESETN